MNGRTYRHMRELRTAQSKAAAWKSLTLGQQRALIDKRYCRVGWVVDSCVQGLRSRGLVEEGSARLTVPGMVLSQYGLGRNV